MPTYFYAVDGEDTGKVIYDSWTEAKPHCVGVKGVRYKKFVTKTDAAEWLGIELPTNMDTDTTVTTLDIYTDGACSKNGGDGANAGIGVYFGDGDPRNVSAILPPHEKQTNNRAELTAIETAIDIVLDTEPLPPSVNIFTDSTYSHKALTEWVHGWVKKRWMTSKGTPVENRDVIERTYEKLQELESYGCDVQFYHVKAHSGVYGNEQADWLATQAQKVAKKGVR